MAQSPETSSNQTNIVPVEFNPDARRDQYHNDLESLPKGEQGFLGTHLEVDKRTGGFKRDEHGQPIPIQKPENPFE